MAMNKLLLGSRGVVFTLMAIVIASVIVVSAGVLMDPGKQTDTSPDHIRVKVVDGVINSFKSYAASAFRVSVYASLNNLTDILANQSDIYIYFEDLDALEGNLSNCLFNKNNGISLGGKFYTCNNEKTFTIMLQNFSDQVWDNFNINLSFVIDNSSFNIWEEFPFEATTNLTMNLTVTDSRASWYITDFYIETSIPLDGLQDPVTAKFANSGYADSSLANTFIDGDTPKNVSQLEYAITEGVFSRRVDAPSILQRFFGDFTSASCGSPEDDFVGRSCGVESFIDGQHISWGNWPAEHANNYSHVDYELFASEVDGSFKPRAVVCDSQMYSVAGFSSGAMIFWSNLSTMARLNVTNSLTTC